MMFTWEIQQEMLHVEQLIKDAKEMNDKEGLKQLYQRYNDLDVELMIQAEKRD